MLRCLVFLWPDFSQVGLRTRGESKKSATWGAGGRKEDSGPDHRWEGGDGLARGAAARLSGQAGTPPHLSMPPKETELSWGTPSDEGQVGKQASR